MVVPERLRTLDHARPWRDVPVRFLQIVIEPGHVEVTPVGPFVRGDVPDARADEHERAVPVREASHDAHAPPDLAVEPFDHVVRADAPAVPVREPGQQVGRGLADPLPQAVGGGLQPPGLHLRGDGPGLVQRGFPGLHGEHGLQGRRRPFPAAGRHLGEHVAQEVHHAPLAPRLRRHRVHRGDRSRAPVADHEPDALQAAFDHAAKELPPAGGILPHALGDADDLAVTILADADGDQDADVLHASAPGALVPHAVHEHVWVLVIQRPRAPFVDLGVHALELAAQCPGRHAVAPQQLAGVVDLPGGHDGQAHVDQRPPLRFPRVCGGVRSPRTRTGRPSISAP